MCLSRGAEETGCGEEAATRFHAHYCRRSVTASARRRGAKCRKHRQPILGLRDRSVGGARSCIDPALDWSASSSQPVDRTPGATSRLKGCAARTLPGLRSRTNRHRMQWRRSIPRQRRGLSPARCSEVSRPRSGAFRRRFRFTARRAGARTGPPMPRRARLRRALSSRRRGDPLMSAPSTGPALSCGDRPVVRWRQGAAGPAQDGPPPRSRRRPRRRAPAQRAGIVRDRGNPAAFGDWRASPCRRSYSPGVDTARAGAAGHHGQWARSSAGSRDARRDRRAACLHGGTVVSTRGRCPAWYHVAGGDLAKTVTESTPLDAIRRASSRPPRHRVARGQAGAPVRSSSAPPRGGRGAGGEPPGTSTASEGRAGPPPPQLRRVEAAARRRARRCRRWTRRPLGFRREMAATGPTLANHLRPHVCAQARGQR